MREHFSPVIVVVLIWNVLSKELYCRIFICSQYIKTMDVLDVRMWTRSTRLRSDSNTWPRGARGSWSIHSYPLGHRESRWMFLNYIRYYRTTYLIISLTLFFMTFLNISTYQWTHRISSYVHFYIAFQI